MTNESKLRHIFVAKAMQYLGFAEINGQDDLIIDRYNEIKPIGGYKMNHQDAWCAAFVSVVKHEAGFDRLIPTDCSCQQMIEKFKAMGRYQEDGRITPQEGDIIFFNWDDATQPNDGWADHVGIVVSVTGNTIRAIEGNASDKVKYRDMSIGWGYIRGYGLPNFASISKDEIVPVQQAPVPTPAPQTVLSSSIIKNARVGSWQNAMNIGFDLVDENELAVDHSFGPKSQAFANANQLHKNIKGCPTAVIWLQTRLKEMKFYTGRIDGKFEDGTENAVVALEKARGLTPSGWVGVKVTTELLK